LPKYAKVLVVNGSQKKDGNRSYHLTNKWNRWGDIPTSPTRV